MPIREEFDNRVREINSFYEILRIVELEMPRIVASNIEEEAVTETQLDINSSKIDTLRSTTYLLLYNLIESTVHNSVRSIFDEITDKELKYFDLIEGLQKYWLNNRYKHDETMKKETVVKTIMTVAVEIFDDIIELQSDKIEYGGSLDAKRILATADSMQIDVSNVRRIYKRNQHGQIFRDIKEKRNWLAHGEKSFIEVGSTSTFNDLQNAKDNVVAFLNEFITAVETYISEQQYKKVATGEER